MIRTGELNDEDVEEQEDILGHGGGIRYTAAVWTKYGSYYCPGRLVDVDNVPGDIRKKLPTTAEKYTICWYG